MSLVRSTRMLSIRDVPDRLGGIVANLGFRSSRSKSRLGSWYAFFGDGNPTFILDILAHHHLSYEWRPIRRRRGRKPFRSLPSLPPALTARPKSR